MKHSDSSQDLVRWLNTATRGLPAETKAQIRGEIEAHYQDALQAHLAGGKSMEVARRAALADLGQADETGCDLREIHLADRWYIAAMVIGLLFPAIMWLAFTLEGVIQPLNLGAPVAQAIILLPTFFILYVFRKLLMQIRT